MCMGISHIHPYGDCEPQLHWGATIDLFAHWHSFKYSSSTFPAFSRKVNWMRVPYTELYWWSLGSKSACSKPIHYHEYTRTSGWAFSSLINRWCVFLKTIVTGTLFEHKSMKEWNDKSPVLWYLNSDQLMSFLSHFSVTQLHSTNLKNQLRTRVLYLLDTPRTQGLYKIG